LLLLEHLFISEKEGELRYRHGKENIKQERMDYMEFIASITDYPEVDMIINHFKLIFTAEQFPQPQHAQLFPYMAT